MSPAKHSYASVTDGRTDQYLSGHTDKVIPMCRYASQATQKLQQVWEKDRSQQVLHMQVPNGMRSGVWRSKRPPVSMLHPSQMFYGNL